MEKVFILKTVDCDAVECSNLLGKRFFRVDLRKNCPIPDILKSYLKPSIERCEKSGDVKYMPLFKSYIIGDDGEVYPLDSSIKILITCNGTTIEKINVVNEPEDWNEFWIGIFNASGI